MLRRYGWRLCSITLDNGTVLKGKLNPHHRHRLLSGVAILPDGRTYSGKFHEVLGHPLPGSQLEEDGDLYRGSFNQQWQREGQGEAWLADGTHYLGTFEGDELTCGTVRVPNGATEIVFDGTLRDELFVKGRLTQPDFMYEGEFKNNEPHGKGQLVFSTGAEQEGTFLNGKLHGSNCKMRLEGGFVYVGDFMDGTIRRGILYTPTYTYDGEFNDHGRAHGEGSQTYLASDPRLTFTGLWNNGALVRGVCMDEYGTPVDWQNNNDLQTMVLGGGDASSGQESVAVNSYCSAKLKEADQLHRDMQKGYVEDAERVAQRTQRYPSKMDLGYEGSIAHENAAVHEANQKQMAAMNQSKELFADRAHELKTVTSQAHGSIIGELNENMAKLQFSRQVGAEQLSSQRIDEQFERFMKSFDAPKPSSGAATVEGGRLNIEGNAPWKSFTPPSK